MADREVVIKIPEEIYIASQILDVNVGDYIKCNNETDLLNTHEELEKAGIEVDFVISEMANRDIGWR